MYAIMAQQTGQKFSGNGAWRNDPQEVDEAETLRQAEYLVREYHMAYGPGWNVWYQEKED